MEVELLGWADEGPTLDLDHRSFSYAGKFVMSNTGKAVLRDGSRLLGAAAFNTDRTDPRTMWIRYLTIRRDRQGEGLGPRLLRFARDAAHDRGFDRVRIAVNNPYAYQACFRAGFGFTGRTTGIAELVLEWPAPPDDGYHEGLERFVEMDTLPERARAYAGRKLEGGSPATPGDDPPSRRE